MVPGLVLIGVICALVGVAACVRGRSVQRVLGVSLFLWVFATLAFAALLLWEAEGINGASDLNSCPVPGQDSTYAPSKWSWLPPGAVCEFKHGDVGPTWWRVPALFALIGAPVGAAVVAKRRDAPIADEGPAFEEWVRRRDRGWAVLILSAVAVVGSALFVLVFGHLFL